MQWEGDENTAVGPGLIKRTDVLLSCGNSCTTGRLMRKKRDETADTWTISPGNRHEKFKGAVLRYVALSIYVDSIRKYPCGLLTILFYIKPHVSLHT
jgi:hypothetical protein